MATDIATAVGVLSLLGARGGAPLELFLLALAIVDDIGAVVVIAVFYSDRFDSAAAFGAIGAVAAMVLLRVVGSATSSRAWCSAARGGCLSRSQASTRRWQV